MNDAGTPPPWDSVLERAHRRFWARLAVLAGAGAVGAALLLGGGTAGRAAIENDASSPPPPRLGEPNLTITGLAPVTVAGEGEEAPVWSVTVTNDSDTASEAFTVTVTPADEGEASEVEFSPLAAGEEDTEEFSCTGLSALVEIDAGGDVAGDPEIVECGSTDPVDLSDGDDEDSDEEHETATREEEEEEATDREAEEASTAIEQKEEEAETLKDAETLREEAPSEDG